jgi:hypothetical protein
MHMQQKQNMQKGWCHEQRCSRWGVCDLINGLQQRRL